MKKIIIATILSFFVISCAHHHKKDAHHHHQCSEKCETKSNTKTDCFNHKCASSVLEGDIHVEGKEEFKLEHGGQIYYFSTLEKKNKFEKNLEQNIELAKKSWEHEHDHGRKGN